MSGPLVLGLSTIVQKLHRLGRLCPIAFAETASHTIEVGSVQWTAGNSHPTSVFAAAAVAVIHMSA